MLKIIDAEQGYLDGIINSIADPIFVKDVKHRWVYMNDAFCDFIGHSREDMIGKSDFDFFPVEESKVFWEKDEFVFNEQGGNINEENITDAKGKTHTIVTKKVMFMDQSGNKFIVGIIRDVTERKLIEDKLNHKIKDLEAEVKDLQEKLASASKNLEKTNEFIVSHNKTVE